MPTPPSNRVRTKFLSIAGLAVAGSLILASPFPVAAQRGPDMEKADLSVHLDRTSYAVGESGRIGLLLTIDDGWHTNSNTPTFDYLIPVTAEVALPEGWPGGEIEYPEGIIETFSFAEEPLSVYEGEALMLARFAPPEGAEGTFDVPVSVRYQACNDTSCLPPVTTEAVATIEVGASGDIANQDVFAAKAVGHGEAGGSAPVEGANLLWILALGVFGGLVLNAMPCVLPVLSLKVFGLVKSAGKGRSQVVFGALATAAGILLSFLGLAVAAIAARSAGAAVGWGVQFQEPAFVAALAVIVILFSLNLWGVFEIPLPQKLAMVADSGPKEGVAGHLVSGLFATLMATPCSAPFLGTAIGFALAQPAGTILLVFAAVGFGMALPYFALAVFPKAAGWLPKPGPWMSTFKMVMGFLLAAAAVWLFYVLAAQIAPERVAFVQLALLLMAAAVWWRTQTARGGTKTAALVIASVAAIATVGLARGADATAKLAASEAVQLIDWQVFDRAEAERLADSGRLVFVDVTADWCFTCKVNERLVLETPEVAGAFEEHDVIAMKADWTNRDDDIAQFLADHGRYGIPFYLLYRPEAEPFVFSELLTKDAVREAVGG